jgi:hypothetical protein
MLLHLVSNDCSQSPVADAAADLRLDLKIATHLLRLSGCTTDKKKRGSNEAQATLTVPLTFPPATGSRKRGRR